MSAQEDWGQDPSVRSMRRVFAGMEAAQKKLLGCLNISPLDSRLRRYRDKALAAFERTWGKAVRKGAVLSEDDLASLYANCLARELSLDGVNVFCEALPQDEKIIKFMNEGLK